jgi:hypothetical protein
MQWVQHGRAANKLLTDYPSLMLFASGEMEKPLIFFGV